MTNNVHHDTFACVVLEAFACGVTVITWDVACMKGVYGDNIHLLKPPSCNNYNPFGQFEKNQNMRSESSMKMFIDKIDEIEKNPIIKLEHKKKSSRVGVDS